MNKKTLLLIALSWILVGCSNASHLPSDGKMFGASGTVSVPGCTPDTGPMPTCSGNKNYPIVLVNLDSDPFEIAPKCVNAKKGKTIKVHLVSATALEKGDVVLFPEDPGNYPWLAGINSPSKNMIKIKVPAEKETGDYKYGIWTSDRCVDPRINVEN